MLDIVSNVIYRIERDLSLSLGILVLFTLIMHGHSTYLVFIVEIVRDLTFRLQISYRTRYPLLRIFYKAEICR